MIKEKYAVINVHSTAQLKYWNHPKGKEVRNNALYWTELCTMLKNNGITPIIVELNKDWGVPPHFNGLPKGFINKIGRPLKEVVNYIQHAEFFIGLGSGSSWLSWALKKQVVMICNFSDKNHEFTTDCLRIIDESVCNGCWNNPNFKFDRGDWYWCPIHKGTNRQFECQKSITAVRVIEEIKKAYLL